MSTSTERHKRLSRTRVPPKDVLTHPWSLVAFGFGAGLSPVAPGTVGTLVAIPIFLLANSLSPPAYVAIILVLFYFGVIACTNCQRHLKVSDHPGIVIDEIIGFMITMAFCPASIASILGGFVLFRLFDILKPWPIRWIDRRIHGGFGVMLDDVIAGVFAAFCLRIISGTYGL